MRLSCVLLLALSGCGGGTKSDGGTGDLAAQAGTVGAACFSVCDCNLGLDCLNGLCAKSAAPSLCCSAAICPPNMACRNGNDVVLMCPGSTTPDGGMSMPDQAVSSDSGTFTDGGEKVCMVAGDCTNACPQNSKGCTCYAPAMGQKFCAPTCGVTADCPTGTCMNGVCVM